jgi:hypothetical protein
MMLMMSMTLHWSQPSRDKPPTWENRASRFQRSSIRIKIENIRKTPILFPPKAQLNSNSMQSQKIIVMYLELKI